MNIRTKHVFSLIFIIMVIILILVDFSFSLALESSFEETLSHRRSTHPTGTFTDLRIGERLLLKVLWGAYGYTISSNRSIPSIGGGYPLLIYAVNASGCYHYIPEDNNLVLHDLTITKNVISPHIQGWPSEADSVLIVVWNKTIMDNQYFTSAEAGCLAQNVYLVAASLGLGTCCVGGVSSERLRMALNISQDLIPLLIMPLGYPVNQYPSSSPNYEVMRYNLPPIQKNRMSLNDTILLRRSHTKWSSEDITSQELSQLLWAAYGSSNNSHRTTPSAFGIYPLKIYILNPTGVYLYVPEKVHRRPPEYYHYIEKILDGDIRRDVITAITTNSLAFEAPSIFIIAYDSEYNHGNTGDGSAGPYLDHEFIEINAGCVIQNIFLEATALNLGTTVLIDDLEKWNGIGASKIRSFLNLSSGIIPLYVMPVGHLPTDISPELIVFNISQFVISPQQIKPGDTVSISFRVTNIGDVSGARDVETKVNGVVIFSKNLYLDIGESVLLNTSVSLESKGDHMIEIMGMKEVLSVGSRLYLDSPIKYIVLSAFIIILISVFSRSRKANRM